jgi:hypothetical protein
MTGLLLYGYCQGVVSSRKIEKATYESVPFRVLAANQHPDHDTIAEFRRRHLSALSGLFVQVLHLCQRAGLVRLGHVALDGTKLRANASKHKAMSYGRMKEKIPKLEAQVAALLAEAEAVDTAEDVQYGQGRRGDELPEELRFRQRRLEKIRQAKAALEAEVQAEAQGPSAAKGAGDAEAAPEDSAKPKLPAEKAQRNFTDPDSRIMRDGATKSFEQSYNCQAAVDDQAQVIVAGACDSEGQRQAAGQAVDRADEDELGRGQAAGGQRGCRLLQRRQREVSGERADRVLCGDWAAEARDCRACGTARPYSIRRNGSGADGSQVADEERQTTVLEAQRNG